MRTGNALFSVTFQLPGASEVRLTLLDDGEDGIAELVDPGAPWEESATVPVEQMSRFRVEAETLPERWAPIGGASGHARLVVGIESNGCMTGFEARVADGTSLPDEHSRLLELVARTVETALVGARSRRAIAALVGWLRRSAG